MGDINVPTIFLHTEEAYTDDGILMAASSNEQARRAVGQIGDCRLREQVGNHNIHRFHSRFFLDAISEMIPIVENNGSLLP